MKKILGICLALVCISFNSVAVGREKPDKDLSSFDCNDQISVMSSFDVAFVYEITPSFEFACDVVIENNSYKIEKNKSGLVNFVGIYDHPLRLCRWDSKFKVNEALLYKNPHVDRSYIWEYSHQFNC